MAACEASTNRHANGDAEQAPATASDVLLKDALDAPLPPQERVRDSAASVVGVLKPLRPSAAHASGAASSEAAPASKWKAIGRKVQMGLSTSDKFSTLRDRYGINEIEAHQLSMVKKLGEGAFATVERCRYTAPGGKPMMVAVKRLKPNLVSHEEDLLSFFSEMALMRKLKHKNIVQYIGVGSKDKSSPAQQRNTMFLVLELMDGGTLKKLVMQQMACSHRIYYTHAQALRWCTQIADALAYLHESKPQCIHRDLKLENILLKTVGKGVVDAKLADFGLVAFIKRAAVDRAPAAQAHTAGGGEEKQEKQQQVVSAPAAEKLWAHNSARFLEALVTMDSASRQFSMARLPSSKYSKPLPVKALEQLSGRTGTLMYMAPEMYKGQVYDEKVDVFSFAVLCYETFHRYMMVFAVTNKGTEEEIEQYAAKVAAGWRPPLSDRVPAEVLSIIQDAWAHDPKERPSMAEIRDRLRSIQLDGGDVRVLCNGCVLM